MFGQKAKYFMAIVAATVLVIICIPQYRCRHRNRFETQSNKRPLSFDVKSGVLTIRNMDTKMSVSISLAIGHPYVASWNSSDDMIKINWSGEGSSKVYAKQGGQCYGVISSYKQDSMDCVWFGNNSWYGGAEIKEQAWPINSGSYLTPGPIVMYPFISHNIAKYDKAPGSVLERYWLSSAGVAIFIGRNEPLQVGYNATHLCFKASASECWYPQEDNGKPELRYTVCTAGNVKAVHQLMARQFWKRPTDIPDERMIKYPIWTTWAKYHKRINQTRILQYAKEINEHGFQNSQLEIDDMFSGKYGDFNFDLERFPDPKDMIQMLKNIGFRVTLWIHPFINIDAKSYENAIRAEYEVKAQDGKDTVSWWDGEAAILDMSNKAAVSWYFRQRRNLDQLGVDSYKYDAGETSFLPCHLKTNVTLQDPNIYSTLYAEAAYLNTNRAIEMRVAYQTQHLPLFVRVMDVNSVWQGNRGLDIIIPTVFQFGTIGYPFVLPDIIGGNAYLSQFPSKELFIRWTQLTAFLPSMQFSIVPWQYDKETVNICQTFVQLHADYVAHFIVKWSQHALKTGDPIIRPLWWIDPTDSNTYNISTQFTIGDDVLVAPILEKGKTQRDIYIPKGTWLDKLKNILITGPSLLKNYQIHLHQTAYFEHVIL